MPRKDRKAWRRSLVEKFGGGCVIPGCEEDRPSRLQFAHIKPTPISGSNGRGSYQRLYDIEKHRHCYRLMCRRHHVQFDNGEIDLQGNQLNRGLGEECPF